VMEGGRTIYFFRARERTTPFRPLALRCTHTHATHANARCNNTHARTHANSSLILI
jgi:hypothetical protein